MNRYQLTFARSARKELETLPASVVANCDHLQRLKFSPVLPHAFTERGAIMAATVLNTSRAIQVSIYVVEAFVRLRELLSSNRELANKLAELERRVAKGERGEPLEDVVRRLRLA